VKTEVLILCELLTGYIPLLCLAKGLDSRQGCRGFSCPWREAEPIVLMALRVLMQIVSVLLIRKTLYLHHS
jgi:hypothetical protein